MPFGHKTPGAIAAEIKMTRTVHNGALLIVEGKHDERFWGPRCHLDCNIIDAEGKHNVLGSIQRLDADGITGVFGIVDDDHDSLMNVSSRSANVIATDTHDLECMLVRSSALEFVLAEHGNQRKISAFEAKERCDVRTGLLHRALIFGRVRWIFRKCKISIDWNSLPVQRFIEVSTWKINSNDVIEAILRRYPEITDTGLNTCMTTLPAADPWKIVRGYDLLEILRAGLMEVIGDMRNSVGVSQIQRLLRAAMSQEDLRSTDLFKAIRLWESNNREYTILKDQDTVGR